MRTFHPAVARWFAKTFPEGPSEVQDRGWAEIQRGRHTLIAAPTGSGKTLAAFLAAIDALVRSGVQGELRDETTVLYLSPLKALGNDIQKNLAEPLRGIADAALELGQSLPVIRTAVRSGDTKASERAAILRHPPHLLITTPESLYLLLTSQKGRDVLRTIRTVIVDEIHALADDKRGSHLALSLERLQALTGAPLQRIGLSATQHPIEEVARFLVGSAHVGPDGVPDCAIVDANRPRALDLAIEIPLSELGAVAASQLWEEVYDRLAELIRAHRTTLVFVNTRRLVERVAHALQERLGQDQVAAHHGSLSRARRLDAEQRLKAAEIKAAVATASLELGVDLGAVELVCQIGSPRSFSVGVQRIGRSGHFKGAIPKGRLFPLSRDELLECAALVRGLLKRRLDKIEIPVAPLDVLCQQLAATCAADDWAEDDLYALARRAWPYHALGRQEFDELVEVLSEGFAPGLRAKPLLHRDGVNHVLRGRRGTRLTALTSGGAIPDQADFAVIAEPDETQIGTVNEDFVAEASVNDTFMLGTSSWRLLRVENGRVRVASADGIPASVPFWFGEAPGRTAELSDEVSLLRQELEPRLADPEAATAWLAAEGHLPVGGARQAVAYLREAVAALGTLPTTTTLIAERFFDEAGGMQLVVHAPFGARLNRGFGLALRKSFCKTFDFELQAAATDDAVLLSLGPQHSFPLETIFELVHPDRVKETLTAAVLLAPMFAVRWRWTGQRSLALLRRFGGKPIPPNIQRMRADDLLAAVFPQHAGCQENAGVNGPLTAPDHPLVNETLRDCLTEATDLHGLTALLRRMRAGGLTLLARDLPEPSVLAHEILNARPYAYLDDAPLEERRARAVQTRRASTHRPLDALALLDPEAIAAVRAQAAAQPRDAEELHDLLLQTLWWPLAELGRWQGYVDALAASGRVTALAEGLCATERIAEARAALAGDGTAQERLVRGFMDLLGPVTTAGLAAKLRLSESDVSIALHQIEAKGGVLRGHFSPGVAELEWCERGLLSRIHRLTLGRLRREIEPVTTAQFLRFLFSWQHVAPSTRLHGVPGLTEVLGQLQGFPAAAGAWEREILPARVANYDPFQLDQLCLQGRVAWGRLSRQTGEREGRARRGGPTRAAPIAFAYREDLGWLLGLARRGETPPQVSAGAALVRELLTRRGALFLPELQALSGRLATELEQDLWELVALGEVTGDGFGGVRALIEKKRGRPRTSRRSYAARRGLPHASAAPLSSGGRWSLLDPVERSGVIAADVGSATETDPALVERLAHQLLRRYGVVFRDLLGREAGLPPWRELLWVYRRLEARGGVRGGRFVSGAQGEQFALPEAVEALRAVRRDAQPGQRVELSAADPLNLVGILTPDGRVPAVLGHKVSYLDGVPQLAAPEAEAPLAAAEG